MYKSNPDNLLVRSRSEAWSGGQNSVKQHVQAPTQPQLTPGLGSRSLMVTQQQNGVGGAGLAYHKSSKLTDSPVMKQKSACNYRAQAKESNAESEPVFSQASYTYEVEPCVKFRKESLRNHWIIYLDECSEVSLSKTSWPLCDRQFSLGDVLRVNEQHFWFLRALPDIHIQNHLFMRPECNVVI